MSFSIVSPSLVEESMKNLHIARKHLLAKLEVKNDPRIRGLIKTTVKFSEVRATTEVTVIAKNTVRVNWNYIHTY